MPDDTTTDDTTDTPPPPSNDVDHWKSMARRHERENKRLQTEIDEIRKNGQTDQEKALDQARREARTAALIEANDRLVRAEVRAAAGQRLADPRDAAALLGELGRFVNDDGDVDDKAIGKAIDDLVKAKPYLAAAAMNPGSADGGTRPPPKAGGDMNAEIRRLAGLA